MTERNGDVDWLPTTRISEAATWALHRTGYLIPLWIAAVRSKNAAEAEAFGKQLRHISTRLDAFVRMRARQWDTGEKTPDENKPRNNPRQRSKADGLEHVGDVAGRLEIEQGDGKEGAGRGASHAGIGRREGDKVSRGE